ncbi:hypothetical protein [Pseudoxanthomonas daejeonensis]|uniref:Methyltransferase type 11 domain-containing protein n=1 Tax=Pseudoxanthomonas daejeonensis TaxID=266062 RepID=A0ABQ6Z4A1_9GAMM|nr:hypothetical protein [Pseudoxanthomonas daejeonensis]KAF1691938.1 hypothetical protein CSC65_15515 [Pseudoxanthomonas daejeonensis]
MPVAAPSRQPGASIRFSGKEAQWLLAEERRWLATQLAARPARPWLWLVPPSESAPDWVTPPPRGLLLRPEGGVYAGTVRCGLPLPLPSECLGDVVLQHPGACNAGPLIEECARVLVDGGRLWLFLANPWSPYRLRCLRDLPASAAGPWQKRLRDEGLQVDMTRFIGPCWRMLQDDAGDGPGSGVSPLRACRVIVAEKRGLAPVAPAPRGWRHGAAPAA